MGNISKSFYRDIKRANAEKRAANNKFAVVSLKKDGLPRKVMPEDIRNGFTEMGAAMLQADKMKELNPGKTFVVVEIDKEAEIDIPKENKILQRLIAKQCGVDKNANASWPDLAEIFTEDRANFILREAFIGILVVGGKCTREEAPAFIEKQIAGASERINAFEILHSQVCNGGFQQWLMNGYGELAEITVCTLEDIGTENALKVAEMVKKIAAEVEINSDDKDFIYDPEFCEYLDAQDTLFYELSDALQEEFAGTSPCTS